MSAKPSVPEEPLIPKEEIDLLDSHNVDSTNQNMEEDFHMPEYIYEFIQDKLKNSQESEVESEDYWPHFLLETNMEISSEEENSHHHLPQSCAELPSTSSCISERVKNHQDLPKSPAELPSTSSYGLEEVNTHHDFPQSPVKLSSTSTSSANEKAKRALPLKFQTLTSKSPSNKSLKYLLRGRRDYTIGERRSILSYIVNYERHTEVKGRKLWMDMEEDQVCPGRTWQSLKEHFRKNIVHSLWLYNIKRQDMETLTAIYGTKMFDDKSNYSRSDESMDSTRNETMDSSSNESMDSTSYESKISTKIESKVSTSNESKESTSDESEAPKEENEAIHPSSSSLSSYTTPKTLRQTTLAFSSNKKAAIARAKSPYTFNDDVKIIKYVIQNRGYEKTSGKKFWQLMEEDNIVPGRSWQSLKERFRMRIIPKIAHFESLGYPRKILNRLSNDAW